VGSVLLERAIRGDGTADRLGDVARAERFPPAASTLPLRAQIRPGLQRPAETPHFFVETTTDGATWTPVGAFDLTPGYVTHGTVALDPGRVDLRLRWELVPPACSGRSRSGLGRRRSAGASRLPA
jgi:hypothetical protein